ncbi:MAG: hypothetical protein LBQ12_08560 [Deltaproteobacteria bacterium]|jgi:hypothetical protein|nr:hypothetical protein [Deltaproteobacteria bacterium]
MAHDKSETLPPPAGRPGKAKADDDFIKSAPPGKGMVRLNIDIDADLHTRLTVYAAKRRKTMAFVIRELLDKLGD